MSVLPIAYRPLDERFFCPVTPLCHRPRPELARALAHEGAALVSVRKDRGDVPWRHAAWVGSAVDNCYLSARSSCRARAFPARTPDGDVNLSPQVQEQLAAIGVDDARAFPHYALTILSAASYQLRWDAELRQDYPRIPLPRTAAAFRALAETGRALAELFSAPLMAADDVNLLEPPKASFRDLSLSAADGGIELAGTRLFQLTPRALELRIGHHRPLHAFIGSRASQPLTRAGVQSVLVRAERLIALERALQAIEAAVAREFDWPTR